MRDTTSETRKNHTSTGGFAVGNKASVGHRPAGGRPTSEVKALLRQEGLKALPRIQQIAEDPKHREHFKANVWLAERGLKDDLEGRGTPKPSEAVSLPAWGKIGDVQWYGKGDTKPFPPPIRVNSPNAGKTKETQ